VFYQLCQVWSASELSGAYVFFIETARIWLIYSELGELYSEVGDSMSYDLDRLVSAPIDPRSSRRIGKVPQRPLLPKSQVNTVYIPRIKPIKPIKPRRQVIRRVQTVEADVNVEEVVALMLDELDNLPNNGASGRDRRGGGKIQKTRRVHVPEEPGWIIKERKDAAKKKASELKLKSNQLASIRDTELRWSRHMRTERHKPRTQRQIVKLCDTSRPRSKWRCQDPDPIDQKILRDKQQELWLNKRHLGNGTILATEKHMFHQWFNSIDADGNGFISAEEIADPLISTGVAKTAKQVQDFVKSIDINGDGRIEREELLRIYASKKPDHMFRRMLHALEDAINVSDKGHALSENLAMSIARRKCLMESVMVDRAAIAQKEKQLLHQRTTAIRLNDQRMLRSNSHALNLLRAQMSNKEMQDETISGLMETVRRQQ
jgi:hypothetical protein